LEEKLKTFTPPTETPPPNEKPQPDEKPTSHQPTKDEYVPLPTPDQPLTPQQEKV